jgi:hypothetical protein
VRALRRFLDQPDHDRGGTAAATIAGDLGRTRDGKLTRLRGLGPFFVFGPLNINGLG